MYFNYNSNVLAVEKRVTNLLKLEMEFIET